MVSKFPMRKLTHTLVFNGKVGDRKSHPTETHYKGSLNMTQRLLGYDQLTGH